MGILLPRDSEASWGRLRAQVRALYKQAGTAPIHLLCPVVLHSSVEQPEGVSCSLTLCPGTSLKTCWGLTRRRCTIRVSASTEAWSPAARSLGLSSGTVCPAMWRALCGTW